MNTMTTDLITALQTHGEVHKGTDLGGVLQWAILHIQEQDKSIKGHRELMRFVISACTGYDMASVEGRSRFVSIIKPHWERLPKSAFKRQLLGEIATLTNLWQTELLQIWGLLKPPYRQARHEARAKK